MCLGSAGSQPAVVGSLPTMRECCKDLWRRTFEQLFGRLPKGTGWQPVVPGSEFAILLNFSSPSFN
jgi:hypothetical protein